MTALAVTLPPPVRRIRAMLLRHAYLLLGSWPRLLDLIYWPTVQMILWGFITRYAPQVKPGNTALLDRLVEYAIAYYNDFVKPHKQYRLPTATERLALEDFLAVLYKEKPESTAEELQNLAFEIGKGYLPDNLRGWFQCLYEVLLGQPQGPRIGSFIALYGIPETIALIEKALAGGFLPITEPPHENNVVPLRKAGA